MEDETREARQQRLRIALGERVKLALRLRAISANGLDKAIGKGGDSRYVGRIARGMRANPDAEVLRAMSDHLRVPYMWLHFGEGPEPTADGGIAVPVDEADRASAGHRAAA